MRADKSTARPIAVVDLGAARIRGVRRPRRGDGSRAELVVELHVWGAGVP
jgi:hypothetical protein